MSEISGLLNYNSSNKLSTLKGIIIISDVVNIN